MAKGRAMYIFENGFITTEIVPHMRRQREALEYELGFRAYFDLEEENWIYGDDFLTEENSTQEELRLESIVERFDS